MKRYFIGLLSGVFICSLALGSTVETIYYLSDNKSMVAYIFPVGKYHAIVSNDYTAYGQSQNIFDNFAYNQEYRDRLSQLVYLRSRDYLPDKQRFLVRDSYANIWNKYNFADANPVSNVDYSGHTPRKKSISGYIDHGFKRGILLKGVIAAVVISGSFLFTAVLFPFRFELSEFAQKIESNQDLIKQFWVKKAWKKSVGKNEMMEANRWGNAKVAVFEQRLIKFGEFLKTLVNSRGASSVAIIKLAVKSITNLSASRVKISAKKWWLNKTTCKDVMHLKHRSKFLVSQSSI
ncbi:RHS repeat domain-containing protein [Facilibium subflavum]|uniref:RHS repeat domain-containing protein n=1 Tax=Facilibium subflavum TaxID=2219058 RepID=UPI000E650048|nr:RHS repeat-associated core domain-containing protein [Facilibium subflavum]